MTTREIIDELRKKKNQVAITISEKKKTGQDAFGLFVAAITMTFPLPSNPSINA